MDLTAWLDQHSELVWGIAATLVFGWLFGYVFYWLADRRNRKQLGWEVVARSRLLKASTEKQGKRLVVKVDDVEVLKPNFVTVRIGNVGRGSLTESDFSSPISITFAKSVIRDTSSAGQSPENVELGKLVVAEKVLKEDFSGNTMTSYPNLATFAVKTMNPRNWIEIQFLTDGEIEDPRVHANIASVSKRPVVPNMSRKRDGVLNLLFGVLAVASIFALGVSLSIIGVTSTYTIIVGSILCGLLISIATYSELSRKRWPNRKVDPPD